MTMKRLKEDAKYIMGQVTLVNVMWLLVIGLIIYSCTKNSVAGLVVSCLMAIAPFKMTRNMVNDIAGVINNSNKMVIDLSREENEN